MVKPPFADLSVEVRRAALMLKTALAASNPEWRHVQVTIDNLHEEVEPTFHAITVSSPPRRPR